MKLWFLSLLLILSAAFGVAAVSGGAFFDPAARSVVFILPAETATDTLSAVPLCLSAGYDPVRGFFSGDVGVAASCPVAFFRVSVPASGNDGAAQGGSAVFPPRKAVFTCCMRSFPFLRRFPERVPAQDDRDFVIS